MHPLPRRTLRQLLADHGPALLNEPARVDALLADLCGPYQRERFLLVHALRVRIPATNWPVLDWIGSCSQRLQSQYGFSAEAAQWAVESWSLALDLAPLNPNTLRAGRDIRDGRRTALSESPPRTLRQLLADYGPTLLNEPARVDALLADLCGPYPRERFLLVHALRERIPAELSAQPQGDTIHGQRLSQRLQSRYGFSAEATQWAIESWSLALNFEKLRVPRSRIAAEKNVPTDRDVLVAFYHATNGANWLNSGNWLSDKPLGAWHGVTTDNSGRVTKLSLGSFIRGNKLSGSIPPELANLSNLTHLDLGGNQLSGSIPPELANLSNLTWLSLLNNQLSGSIPAELGNLSNLTQLFLDNNELSGSIPPELGNLSNLTWLFLNNNELSGSIPPELGNLSNLTSLSLWNNELSGSILSGADRDVLVAFYHATDGANWLNSDNWLSDKPLGTWYGVTTGNIGRVTMLSLSHNELSGSIPLERANLSKLTGLFLSDNELSGSIPPELGNLYNLTSLFLRNNELSGSIPAEIGNLYNLTSLFLNNNQLSGSIPAELANLSNLTLLSLNNNQLSGSIPAELANLSNLTLLSLNNNQLSGSIPPELANLSHLTQLNLANNQLSESIPAELDNLSNRLEGNARPAPTPSPSSSTPAKDQLPPRKRACLAVVALGLLGLLGLLGQIVQ